jgi:hypothetical protein
MNLTSLHEEIDEVTESIPMRGLSDLIAEYSKWFWTKVRERSGSEDSRELKAKADAFLDAIYYRGLGVSALYTLLEEVTGTKIKGAGKDLSFRDGSIINYVGETIMTWIGDKGVDINGHDINGLSRDANDYSIPTTREIRAFVKKFFFDDPRAYSRTMKWVGKTYFNAKRNR